jgi:hypothetical protein
MGLTTDVNLCVSVELTKDTNPNAVARVPFDFSYEKYIQTDQADKVWWDVRTLAASASEDIDLAGVLNDAFGVPITLVSLKTLGVVADPANEADLELGGGATFLGASSSMLIRPDGALVLSAPTIGYEVSPGSTDVIRVTNLSLTDAATYSIIVVGSST